MKYSDDFLLSRRKNIKAGDIVPNYGMQYTLYSHFSGKSYTRTFDEYSDINRLMDMIKKGCVFFTEEQYKKIQTIKSKSALKGRFFSFRPLTI